MLKHPRLVTAIKRQGLLSTNEALSAIHAIRRNDPFGGGEAVLHYGGAERLIRDAIRNRNLH